MFLAASSYASKVDFAFYFIIYTSVILLGLIVGFMLFCVIKYSKKNNPVPTQIEGHVGLETAWTIGPTIIVMMMFYYGYQGWIDMKTIPDDAMEVKVIGKKWSWSYEYKFTDNGVEKVKRSGTLVVPVDRNVKLRIESLDVLHSFYIPAFRMKQDAVPGTPYYMWFRATEVDQKYDVFCAEYCGDSHAYMRSYVEVVSADAFEEWVRKEPPPEEMGEKLFHEIAACSTCHSIDGSKLIGPSLKGIWERRGKVVTDGKERSIVADEEYIINSIRYPQKDYAKGYEGVIMTAFDETVLSDEDIAKIIEYLKTLK
ncbi:cytochrome c oxidase subunit II [Candidatus Uabimicrobium amorphum]|uniref:Cytochrome c oxidase subunit 2 n=1 Tax=Uabimicrobium amorphum TaxID=2596890 RepID=A0A5S9F648_UABAM|nr:cytochrome c oxidase subunit II [Candidatus Uabimicrobium amorphum]BBM87001.1 cytochrome c oxidase subunit 2 [Candidatus Uabimicrobium amorphum]